MSQPSATRQDRIRVAQACEGCREKKSKCDGIKPVCGRCQLKHLDCNYGVTKRIRNQQVMKELATKVAQYESLIKRSAPIQKALQDQVGEYRLDLGTSPGSVDSFQPATTNSTTALTPDPTVAKLALDNPYSEDEILGSVHTESPRPSNATLPSETDICADTDVHDQSKVGDLPLPSRALLEQGIDAFFEATAILFNFFDKDEIFSLFNDVYRLQNPARFKVSLVQLCAAAAVGCQFFPRRFSGDAHVTLVSVAKGGIEDCIEEASLSAMRALALLTLYFAFEKRTAALMYVDMGLRLAKLHRHATMICDQSLTVWQGVFISLVFQDCWLCSSTGQMPSSQASELYLPIIILNTINAPINVAFQFEMIKIAALNASILREVYYARFVSSATVTGYKNQLQQWLVALPPYMRLDHLLDLGERPEYLRPVVLLHLLYMSTIILVYRRILNDLAALGHYLSDPEVFQKTQLFVEPCVWTGRQVAKLLEITFSQSQVLQNCWITASATYSACILLLFSVASRLMHGDLSQQVDQDMAAARHCIKVLTYCGSGGGTASQYLTRASTLHDSITQVLTALTSDTSSKAGEEESAQTSYRLLRLMSLAARYLTHPFDGGYPKETISVGDLLTGPDSIGTETAEEFLPPLDMETSSPSTERAVLAEKDGTFLNDLMHEQNFVGELRARGNHKAVHRGLQRLSFSPPQNIVFGS